MGYINSVAIAQHLHRRVAARAMAASRIVGPQDEIRRDLELPRTQHAFRVYLDNFDQLSKVSQRVILSHTPSLTEFLRKEYLRLKVPRNEKKAVDRQAQAEVQGAWIDGNAGFCCAKVGKVSKYLWALLDLLTKKEVSQKQMQMLTGGLVYLLFLPRDFMNTWTRFVLKMCDHGLQRSQIPNWWFLAGVCPPKLQKGRASWT